MALQDLNQMFSIVKPSDGTPTDYFMRLLRDRGETTQSLEEQVVDLDTQVDTLTTQLAGKADKITNLSAGSGLAGGGDLSADRSFSLNAGLDLLTDVDTSTTPPTDGQALVWVAADSLWKPGTVSGGGGGGGGGSTLIGTVTATGSSNVLTISAIPSTFDHLEVFLVGSGSSGSNVDAQVTFNGDTGANYAYDRINRFGASTSGSANWLELAGVVGTGALKDPSSFKVLNYKNTGYNRQALAIMGTTAGGPIIQSAAGWWNNTTNAITSIEVTLPAGNWEVGSQLWVYGIGGAGGGGGSSTERTRVKPVTSNFTLLNPGTATMTNGTQGIVLNAPNPGGNNIRFIASNTAPPAAPYSVIMRSQPVFYNAGLNRYGNSLILRNSTTGAIIITGDYDQGFLAQGWSDYFTFATGLYGPQGQDNAPPWQKVENDGTNLKFFMSSDGQDWYEYFSTTIAAHIGSVDQVGFGCFVTNNVVCDIFQSFEVL